MTYTTNGNGTYNILKHLSLLTPSNNSKTKYHCPVCNSPNLDIHPHTGAYACFTNNCIPKDIRTAIDNLNGKPQFIPYHPTPTPAWKKPIRPERITNYDYPTRDGQPLVKVKRIDSGNGNKRFNQEHYDKASGCWKNTNPPAIKRQIPIYQYSQTQQAILDGHQIWVLEGESTANKLSEQGLPATTTIGGSGGFYSYGSYQQDLIDALLILAPDRDKAGIKYIHNYLEFFPNQIVGVYLAGDINDWRNQINDGRDIGDDINEFGYTPEQLLERIIPLADYLEIITPTKTADQKTHRREIDYPALARQMGYELDEESLDSHGKLISKIMKLKLDILRKKGNALRFNLMTREIELDGKSIDLNRAKLRCAMIVGYDSPTESCLQALMEVSEMHKYHPVEEYLKSLQGITINNDLLSNIATVFFGNDDPLANLMMRRKLIGAVARIMSPGIKDDSLLILQGKQGTLKSTFLRTLAGDNWFCDHLMSLEHKDELAKLSQHWIFELAEVDYMFRKKEVELFKRFLSAQSDMFRPPYGRANVKVERTGSFWATTNKQEFLTDPTGNRRYWVVEVKQRIDIEAVKQMRDVIWASALAAYKAAEIFHLTPTEDYQLATANSNWADDEDPWDEAISQQLINYLSVQGTTEWIDISTIMNEILHIPLERQDKRQRNRIGNILQLAGFTRKTLRLGELGRKKTWCRDLAPITQLSQMGVEIGDSQNLDTATESLMSPMSPILDGGTSNNQDFSSLAEIVNSEQKIGGLSDIGADTPQINAHSHSVSDTQPDTHQKNSGDTAQMGDGSESE